MFSGYIAQRGNAKETAPLRINLLFSRISTLNKQAASLSKTTSRFIPNPLPHVHGMPLNRSRLLELDFVCVQYRIKGYDAKL